MMSELFKDLIVIGHRFVTSIRYLGIYPALYQLVRAFKHALRYFTEDFTLLTSGTSHWDHDLQMKFRQRIAGLHALLPESDYYSCSIVVQLPAFNEHHKKTLECCLLQTTLNLEIIIGCQIQDIELVKEKVNILNSTFQRREIHIVANKSLSELLGLASKNFVLFIEPYVWLRPDLLYRFEQTLRLYKNPQNLILFCEDGTQGQLEPLRYQEFCAPYYFENSLRGVMFFSRQTLQRIVPVQSTLAATFFFEFVLMATAVGAQVVKIPIRLFGFQHPKQIISTEFMLGIYKHYLKTNGLNWEVFPGEMAETIRVVPKFKMAPQVVAIVLYRDQRELTLKAIKSLLNQDEVRCRIVCVDNNSDDKSIADQLRSLGVEVLEICEPFNFSRLNNLAVQYIAKESEDNLLFFMNNDVELDKAALVELTRWASQPEVGLVGCRLFYPTGAIQHGGVDLTQMGPAFEMNWAHVDSTKELSESLRACIIRSADAVTGAAFMVHQRKFLEVNGFNEIFYPIGYSDVDLARRLRKAGYISIYTPFATGIHHESASRGREYCEDFERSRWLFRATEFSQAGLIEKLTSFDL